MFNYQKRTFIALGTLLTLLPGWSFAEDPPDLMTQTRKLDQKTQHLKKEIMELGRNLADLAWVGGVRRDRRGGTNALSKEMLTVGNTLNQLEDGLLSPPGIQLVVFVSINAPSDFQLQQLEVVLDRERLHTRRYTVDEVELLNHKGTTHRLFTGDIPEGRHKLTLNMIGRKDGEIYRDQASIRFRKGSDRKTIEARVKGSFGKPKLRFKEWD